LGSLIADRLSSNSDTQNHFVTNYFLSEKEAADNFVFETKEDLMKELFVTT